MNRHGLRAIALLCALVGALAAIAAAAGVFLRGDLSTISVTTIRGDQVEVLVDGVYRWNGKAIAAEGVGWDFVTLFAVVPALAFLLPGVARGSLRASLAVTGILAYFLYQYAEYAMFLAYGPLFLLYVAIFSLSLTAIALLVSRIELDRLPGAFWSGFPRRAIVGFALYMSVLLAGMWMPLVAQTMNDAVVDQLEGGSTLVVQAFDLGFLVPLGLFTAATVWRGLPVGYLLASVVVVKGVAMGGAIVAMLMFEAYAGGELQVVPIVLFAATALVALGIAWRLFGSVDERPTLRRAAAGAAAA